MHVFGQMKTQTLENILTSQESFIGHLHAGIGCGHSQAE